jgi:hypothetical protein
MKTLRHQEVLFTRLFEELTQVRVSDPDRIVRAAANRRRRKTLTSDGKLNIITADHPARGVLRSGAEPLALGDRQEFLTRIIRILSADAADGIMASMDVLEDLLIFNDLMKESGIPDFLDEKLMIASLNRGGLEGSVWEMDDPITGPSPESCAALSLDGVKLLLRICYADEKTVATIRYCADAITKANKLKMPIFLEPLPAVKESNGTYRIDKTPEAVAKVVGIATALGDSSRHIWIKVPFCAKLEMVAAATTCPILLLGGETTSLPKFIEQIRDAIASAHNIRGTMVGRNVLYPDEHDPVAVATLVNDAVHKGTVSVPENLE